MKFRKSAGFICLALLWLTVQFQATAEEFTNAVRAFLQDHIDSEHKSVGIVVGIVDEHRSSVVSYGTMDDGNSPEVNGDTLFEIGSVTKSFTALLLQDMIGRKEMKLEDPAVKYLPASIKMPTHGGKEITLLHLATHTSGLPRDCDNLMLRRWTNPYADYTVEQLYGLLSGYTLGRDPGLTYEYSNVGYELLSHVIALKAETSFESLVVDRICTPLGMDSTRITLTPELKARSATGHGWYGKPLEDATIREPTMGEGALRSTAKDMLKFISANLGLTQTPLTPLMQETHVVRFQDVALGWGVSGDWISKGGMTLGCTADVAFDKKRRRGVVVLANRAFDNDAQNMVAVLLESEWQADKRPKSVKLDSHTYDSFVGQYQLTTNHIIGIRRDNDRLLTQETGKPVEELLPQSATNFFLRVSGKLAIFTRDSRGKVNSLITDANGTGSRFIKISDQPPMPHMPPKLPALIRVDTKLYDSCVGRYELPSGRRITISREGDLLLALYTGWAGFELFPASEASFYNVVVPLKFAFAKGDDKGTPTLTVTCPLFEKEFTGKARKSSP